MKIIGIIVRAIKEAPFFNELYRQYTEYKVARNYQNRTAKEIFTEINSQNKWVGAESVSGLGSDIVQSKGIIKELPSLLNTLNISKLVDVPCGDHNWMKEINFGKIYYTGGDIVQHLVNQNNLKYKNAQKKFILIDLTQNELPSADLILIRDCLVHLPFKDIENAMRNLKKSNIRYVLTTHFPRTRRNYDITVGNWRPLNLTKPPFNFPPPISIIIEGCTESYGQYTDKSLGLWEISSLPNS